MEKIVECVPNFSEGRDAGVIDAISAAVKSVPGVTLLGVEPDKDYNRCVVTFVGAPGPVGEAAFRATEKASSLIDMRKQTGEHPRIGATDVVPFVPVSGVTMDECVAISHSYGKRVAAELGIPVYLYEEAARSPDRRNLAVVRKGEYEGLAAKLADPAWKPDYGGTAMNERSGATVTGARFFLIAYNVNLSTNDKGIAHEIALRIRESGRTLKDPGGATTRIPGSLKMVKAMGVLVERLDLAQVSINLTNYIVTPPHVAFEEVRKQAAELGAAVNGSEIVGLVPKEALLMAGKHFGGADEERALVEAAVTGLGLSTIEPFVPEKKIIEYMINKG